MCGRHIFLSLCPIQMLALRKSLQTNFRLLATVHMLQTYLCGCGKCFTAYSDHVGSIQFVCPIFFFCAPLVFCTLALIVWIDGVGFSRCHFNFQFNVRISFILFFPRHCLYALQPFINLLAFSDFFIRIRSSLGKTSWNALQCKQ